MRSPTEDGRTTPMTTRRTLMLAAAGLLGCHPAARAATTTIALRPGQPRAAIQVRTEALPAGEAFVIALAGPAAPEGAIRLPTWYGDGRILRALPIAGREVLVAAFQGNRGTGVAQTLMAVIGCDDAGALRILGIETLSFRDAQVGSATRRLDGGLEAAPERDRLVLRHASAARRGNRRETPERWTTALAWTGRGILAAPATPPRAGEVRRRIDAARARMARLLGPAPVTDATGLDYDGTGIWAVGYAGAPT